jgi:hypothetical protein
VSKLAGILVLGLITQFTLVHAGGGPFFIHGFEGERPIITVRWDGGGDGMTWADEVNWEGDQLPVDGNAVVIEDPGTPTVIYDVSLGTTMLHSLESTESLTLTGGGLEINNGFSWSSNTLTVEAAATLTLNDSFDQTSGTVTGAGPVTIGGLFSWTTGGTQSGSGETIANGGVAISGGGNKFLDARTLTLNVLFDVTLQHSGGVVTTFNNNDTVTKSAGTGEAELSVNFFNTATGTVNVNSGTLTLGANNGAANSEGDFVIAESTTLGLQGDHMMSSMTSISGMGGVEVSGSGADVAIQGTYTASGPLSISGGLLTFDTTPVTVGDITVSGGTLSLTSALESTGTLQQTGGTVTGAADLTLAGLMTWTTGGTQSGSGETIANGGVAISGRTLTLNAASTGFGDLRAQNGATINSNAALEILFDDPLQHAGGADTTFNNNAETNKSGGAGNMEMRADFINAGSLTVDSGSITLERDYTHPLPTGAGTLHVGIAGLADFDNYAISGAANLNDLGTLEVSLLNAYEPNLADSFIIMTFASRVGEFSAHNGLIIGNNKRFDVTYGATSITLTVVMDP